jgi:hypothetical protein
MSLLDESPRAVPGRVGPVRALSEIANHPKCSPRIVAGRRNRKSGNPGSAPHRPLGNSRRLRRWMGGLALVAWVLGSAPTAQGWGGKVALVRKYRPGQTMVYATEVRTRSQVDSEPPDLKSFLPPVPKDLTMRQRNTVTVAAVQPDGAADIQHRVDQFEIQTDLAALPESQRDSAQQAQRELTQRLAGQTLTVHYDREGRLVGFEGTDRLLEELDAPLREPLRQMLRLFLEQMGGQAFYPGHAVKQGEEWTQKLDSLPREDYPFQVQGKSTLRFSGKTRYHGVKAGIVDYHFENLLTPVRESLRQDGALPQLEGMGMRLEIQISGQGKGRVLVALDDGRVLENHSTLHQTLSAHLKGREGSLAPPAPPATIEIRSDTEMAVEGNQP